MPFEKSTALVTFMAWGTCWRISPLPIRDRRHCVPPIFLWHTASWNVEEAHVEAQEYRMVKSLTQGREILLMIDVESIPAVLGEASVFELH